MSRRAQNQPQQQQQNREYDEEDPVISAFRDLDKNSDGKITNHELRYFLTHVGENTYTDEEVDSLFKECGLKDDDELEYEDFIGFWRSQMKDN